MEKNNKFYFKSSIKEENNNGEIKIYNGIYNIDISIGYILILIGIIIIYIIYILFQFDDIYNIKYYLLLSLLFLFIIGKINNSIYHFQLPTSKDYIIFRKYELEIYEYRLGRKIIIQYLDIDKLQFIKKLKKTSSASGYTILNNCTRIFFNPSHINIIGLENQFSFTNFKGNYITFGNETIKHFEILKSKIKENKIELLDKVDDRINILGIHF